MLQILVFDGVLPGYAPIFPLSKSIYKWHSNLASQKMKNIIRNAHFTNIDLANFAVSVQGGTDAGVVAGKWIDAHPQCQNWVN
jgi:hypothetical protein